MTASHRLPTSLCPACGATLDCATTAVGDGSAPHPGDVTFCGTCSELLVFDEQLRQRRPTDEERAGFAQEMLASVERVRGAIRDAAALRAATSALAEPSRRVVTTALEVGFQAGWAAALRHFESILEKNLAEAAADGCERPTFPGREVLATVRRLADHPPRPEVAVIGREDRAPRLDA